ncbi:MAG: hypothetical protein KJ630_15785 [Proteobacteria bacterium]|nr:hypothetical protein [Pseudomonadota bacterium]
MIIHKAAVRTCTIMMCLGLMVLSGCAYNLKPEAGAVAWKDARIALADAIPDGIYETGDVRVTYSLAQKGEICTLTGKLVFDRSLSDSFPVITRFLFYMSYLDDAGKVIETVDISPVIHAFSAIPDSLPLNFSGVRPAGSKAFAFHYYGGFHATPLKEGGQWDIYHFPFRDR